MWHASEMNLSNADKSKTKPNLKPKPNSKPNPKPDPKPNLKPNLKPNPNGMFEIRQFLKHLFQNTNACIIVSEVVTVGLQKVHSARGFSYAY